MPSTQGFHHHHLFSIHHFSIVSFPKYFLYKDTTTICIHQDIDPPHKSTCTKFSIPVTNFEHQFTLRLFTLILIMHSKMYAMFFEGIIISFPFFRLFFLLFFLSVNYFMGFLMMIKLIQKMKLIFSFCRLTHPYFR